MKLKLSDSEANVSEGGYEQSSVDEQEQPSSALILEQSAVSADAGGFILEPHLARLLGMHPGEMLSRSMFYGTPQASHVSILVAQLLDKHEVLIRREIGEGTSSAVRTSEGGCNLALIASNERIIQALLNSLEPPELAEVVQEGAGTTTIHGQVSSAPEQSTRDSDEGFMLSSDLEILESLLHNQELESFAAIQGRVSVSCEDTTDPTATNEGLMRAPMGGLEAPAVMAPTIAVEEFETESEEESVVESEEDRIRKLAKLKAKLDMREQEGPSEEQERLRKEQERLRKERKKLRKHQEKLRKQQEKLRKKEEEAAAKILKKEQEKSRMKEVSVEAKIREREMGTALSVALCREADLEKIKDKVREIIENLEVTGSLSSRKEDMEMMEEKERELRKVVAEPRPENIQEMRKELEKVRVRCKELKQAGAGGAVAEMNRVRTKETAVRADLEGAVARGIKVKGLEEELGALVARKLYLEKMGSNEEGLNEVRTRGMEIEVDLVRLRLMAVNEKRLELELDELVAKRKGIEATIDIGRREIELNRLRKEAKAGSSYRELELMLRLEYVEARVRELELELGLWLGKIEAKRTDTGGGMISLVPGGSEIARAEREEGSVATPEVVSEGMVIQELEEVLVVEEEGVSGSNIGSIRVLEEAVTVIAAELEASGGDIVATTHSQVTDTPEQSTRYSNGGPTLAPDLTMDSIEALTELEKKRKFLVELEEERNKRLARLAESKAAMEMKEQKKKERLRKREEETELEKKRKFLVELEEERNKRLARLAESKAAMEMKEQKKNLVQ
uniref:hypothetical protein n=1 Tax=Candidatus Ichthyocystis sparus TaxID=1561004 RepID=UPI000B1B9C0D